jgi:hypothetical protein
MPKGTKTCSNPDCKREIRGARTLTCPHCQTKIGVSLEEKEAEPRKVVQFPDGYDMPEGVRLTIIHAPAGRCPSPCRASSEDGVITEDDVIEWAVNIRQNMITENQWYFNNNALAYWARQLSVPQNYIGQIKHLPDYEVKVQTEAESS